MHDNFSMQFEMKQSGLAEVLIVFAERRAHAHEVECELFTIGTIAEGFSKGTKGPLEMLCLRFENTIACRGFLEDLIKIRARNSKRVSNASNPQGYYRICSYLESETALQFESQRKLNWKIESARGVHSLS
jgi:hypothetical protein